jgi:hypothetical protein
MNAEDLLRRAFYALNYWMDETSHSFDWELLEDINNYLEKTKTEQEPFSIIQSGCIRGLQLAGKPYPRTCPACGLGPCKIPSVPNPETRTEQDSVATISKMEVVAETTITEQEPVAWVDLEELLDISPGFPCYVYADKGDGDVPLFLHPAPKRKPLNTDEILEGFRKSLNVSLSAFKYGIRYAEMCHGITKE